MRGLAASLLLLTLTLAGCGGGPETPGPVSGTQKVGRPYEVNGVWYHPKRDPNYDRTGIASWYGSKFHGQRTANGEIYDMNELTAAHPTLPLPSRVRVTNLENGRSLVLKVNDRGPFARNRIIDVSRRAAQLLGFRQAGTARVRVQAYPVSGGDSIQVARADTGDTRWLVEEALEENGARNTRLFVQAGAFSDRDSAQRLRNALADLGQAGVSEVTIDGEALYRVRLGPMASVDAADDMLNRVVRLGYQRARIVVDCRDEC